MKFKRRVPIHELRVQIHELRVQIHALRVQIHEIRGQIHESLNQLKLKQAALKAPHFLRLLVLNFPWLQLQQEAEWVNINFERRDLNFPQKSHPSPDYLAFSCVIKLLLPGTVSSSTSYQKWHIRHWMLISVPLPSLLLDT